MNESAQLPGRGTEGPESASETGENQAASSLPIHDSHRTLIERLWHWARPLVGLGLLAYLFWTVDWREMAGIAMRARGGLIALALSITLLTMVPRVLRWQALLVSQGTREPFPRLFTLYLVSSFFNNFLPSDVGGDSVRMLRLARLTGRSADAVSSVLLERLIGLLAVLLMGVAAVLSNWQLASAGGIGFIVLGAFVLFIVGGLLLFNLQGARSRLDRLAIPGLAAVLRKLGSVYDSLYAFRDRRRTLLLVLALSLLFRIGQACSLYVQSRALQMDMQFVWLLMVISLISVVTSLPLSLNALGIQEGAFVFFLGLAGIAPPQALALALLSRAVRLSVSLLGGAIYLLGR